MIRLENIRQYLNYRLMTAVLLILGTFLPWFVFAQNLTARCFVNPLAINAGGTAVWTVEAEGGNGNYSYFWTGSDNLIGASRSVAKIYSRPGTFEATVKVYSADQVVTPSCTLMVLDAVQTLTGSCFAQASVLKESDRVDWRVEAFGGDGRYEFDWSGTDDLRGFGSGISRVYDSPGRKDTTVVITSDGQSTVRECSVMIEPDPELEGECYADHDSVNSGEAVTWTAIASGGTGEYRYSWSGGGLRGNSQAVSEIYEGQGERIANVEITSGSQNITRICSLKMRSNGEVLGAFVGGDVGSSVDGENQKEEKSYEFSFIGWKIVATLFVLLGTAVLISMIVYFKNRADEDEEEHPLSESGEIHENNIVDILESEARKREVTISVKAIEVLIDKTEGDIVDSIMALHGIIDDLKKVPETTVADGSSSSTTVRADESRQLVIGKEAVKKYFSNNKA